ncbi:hypothetical protein J7T55_005215 [Diaporthe amygdali]|uniref:uncharacterized protein n=1 Tax=Phomopsis amygdali TaxID=1214568 RepID=UPI0022FE1C31|nr:uncharacterized protein J7T55_005215 [Diaporthe amygdali]KAJ0116269.1 hypothetical protein J7T55_005215 [Diaporthe amygdali]
MSKNANQGSHPTGDSGEKGRYEYTQAHAPGSGTVVDDNYVGMASSSVAATVGTQTVGKALVSETGTGASMTQHERDDSLRGMGSQFDSAPDVGHISGHSATDYQPGR